MSNNNKKFYRPGTLTEKGTKVSLKTQPYVNGVVFDIDDPISSFHMYLITLKVILEEYEKLRNIPGIDIAIPEMLDLRNGITGKLKLLLDYLIQSPIEINLKGQTINTEILTQLQMNNSEPLINIPEENN